MKDSMMQKNYVRRKISDKYEFLNLFQYIWTKASIDFEVHNPDTLTMIELWRYSIQSINTISQKILIAISFRCFLKSIMALM